MHGYAVCNFLVLGQILITGHFPLSELPPGCEAPAQYEHVTMTPVLNDTDEGVFHSLFRPFECLEIFPCLGQKETGYLVTPVILA